MANSPSSRNHGTTDSALGRARRCAGVDGRGPGRASAVDAADDRICLWGDGGRSWPCLPRRELLGAGPGKPSGGAAASHHQILDLSGAVAAATAPRASSSALEAGDQLPRYGSNFGGVGGLSAIAPYNHAERAGLQLDNVDTATAPPPLLLRVKRAE